MAQLIVKRGPNPKPKSVTISQNTVTLQDWDTLLHNIWLEIMKVNPSLYLDAKISHDNGSCPCKCTKNLYLKEKTRSGGHKRK